MKDEGRAMRIVGVLRDRTIPAQECVRLVRKQLEKVEAEQRDHLKAINAELLAALEAFTAAMDMHLGTAHEIALCEADDKARAAIAKARGE